MYKGLVAVANLQTSSLAMLLKNKTHHTTLLHKQRDYNKTNIDKQLLLTVTKATMTINNKEQQKEKITSVFTDLTLFTPWFSGGMESFNLSACFHF